MRPSEENLKNSQQVPRRMSRGERRASQSHQKRKQKSPRPSRNPIHLTSQNIFYEDSVEMKLLSRIRKTRPWLLLVVIFLILSYYLLSGLSGYKGKCPTNAECGVFVHCNEGYELVREQCQISETTKDNIQCISEAVVESLKLKYGVKQCEAGVVPTQSLTNIMYEYELDTQVEQSQLRKWFQNTRHQELYRFKYHNQRIIPLQKKSSAFFFHSLQSISTVILSIPIIIIAYLGLRKIYLMFKGHWIYNRIKEQLQNSENKQIITQNESLIGKYGEVSNQLLGEIEKARIKDGKIVYFEHWKMI